MILQKFKDVHGFGAKLEWMCWWVRGLFCAICLAALLVGCASDGVSIVFSGSTNTDIANLTIQESAKIPVIAYRSGPYIWAHTRKGYAGWVYFNGSCSVTNHTSALWGMYESNEVKDMGFDGIISPCATNAVEAASAR